MLMYLNYQVWAVIRRRRHLESRFINQHSTALKVEAARQAQLLFGVCFLFLFGHVIRVGLNLQELIIIEEVCTVQYSRLCPSRKSDGELCNCRVSPSFILGKPLVVLRNNLATTLINLGTPKARDTGRVFPRASSISSSIIF